MSRCLTCRETFASHTPTFNYYWYIQVGLLLVSFVSLDVTFDMSDSRLDPSFDTSRHL